MSFLKSLTIFLCLFVSVHVCNEESKKIEVTLISPEMTIKSAHKEVEFEGLISDLSVFEFRLLVNNQPERFVKVKKGYFVDTLLLDQRENTVILYGANKLREQFKAEYLIINTSYREKTESEKIPPLVEVEGLREKEFQIISLEQFNKLKLLATDLQGSVIQAGYVLNNAKTKYLDLNKQGLADLKAEIDLGVKSYNLNVFALDNDGNRASKNYHFRVEMLSCDLVLTPLIGYYQSDSFYLSANIKGGVEPIKRVFSLKSLAGMEIIRAESENNEIALKPNKVYGKEKFIASLDLLDKNAIDSHCDSKEVGILYPKDYPKNFVLKKASLQTANQAFSFIIEPPIYSGNLSVLLKPNDPLQGNLQEEWKVLGSVSFASTKLETSFNSNLTKRLPMGDYLMKLSFSTDSDNNLSFTETKLVKVTRSPHDTVDLLQQILREEGLK